MHTPTPDPSPEGVRRVICARNDVGVTVFASDERVAPTELALLPGAQFFRLWAAERALSSVQNELAPDTLYFPGPGGIRFGVFTVPPDSVAPDASVDVRAGLAEFDIKLPGMLAVLERDHPGMHSTPTIDLLIVMSGEVTLELDDRATTKLRAGDTVVQLGGRHAWRNTTAHTASIAFVLVGASTSVPGRLNDPGVDSAVLPNHL